MIAWGDEPGARRESRLTAAVVDYGAGNLVSIDQALTAVGATVRLVMLPNEAHGYAARETLLHVLAERLNWFDKYVKNAPARTTTDAQR